MSTAANLNSVPVMSPARLIAYFRSPEGMKWVQYGAVSAIAIVVSFSTFTLCYRMFGLNEVVSQTIAVIVSTVPAYFLSRRWVWSLDGTGSMRNEIIPFWVLSFLQFIISLVVVGVAGSFIRPRVDSHNLRTVLLLLVNLATYGAMWFGKFFFLNRILFANKAASPAASA